MKYIVVTGGVFSSIGKGIVSSSLGVLLKFYGEVPTHIKIDPYLNVDSNNMSPFEHGETFVTADGNASDLDLGSYERFLSIQLSSDHNITSGKIYQQVIQKERCGDYLGKTVQVVPHITDAIIEWIQHVAMLPVNRPSDPEQTPEICIIELGGTIGDLEIMPHIQALSQLGLDPNNLVCHVHVSYTPLLSTTKEFKTKPVQHSIQLLRQQGIVPDILCVRCSKPVPSDVLSKLSRRCAIPENSVISCPDISSIYQVPLAFYEEKNIYQTLVKKLELTCVPPNSYLNCWKQFTTAFSTKFLNIHIGIVGKYTGLEDSYLSLTHAIKHACVHKQLTPIILFINSEKLITDFENEDYQKLLSCDAIIIPGGYGARGVDGMKLAAKFARVHSLPCLGICLGLHVQAVEFAEHVLKLPDANSVEIDPDCQTKVVCNVFEGQQPGGVITQTTRLGLKVINKEKRSERHRHRFKINNEFITTFQNAGFKVTANSEDNVVEIMQLEDHVYYIGVQFHPEFNTFPFDPHFLFIDLVNAATQV